MFGGRIKIVNSIIMKKLITIALVTLTSCATVHIPSRHCMVVKYVRYSKHGISLIKSCPDCVWYKYPNQNIHVGDTVEVSFNDRVEPKL
jgi:hypothetical protein